MRFYVEQLGRIIDFGELPEGAAGIRATLGGMIAVAMEASTTDRVQRFAAKVRVSALQRYRNFGWLGHLYTFLRELRHYEADPEGAEFVRDPERVLAEMEAGQNPGIDCDDLAALAVSIILAEGSYEPVLIVAGKEARSKGGRFHHVFYGVMRDPQPAVPVRANVVPFDPQEGIDPGAWPAVPMLGMVKVRQ